MHGLHDIFFVFCTVSIECLILDGHEIRVDEDCILTEPQDDQGDYIDRHILEEMPNVIMRMLSKGEIASGK